MLTEEKTESAVRLVESAKPVFAQVTALVVRDAASRQVATDLWDAVVAFHKQAEAQKEETCRPLKTTWENAKKPFDDFMKECLAVKARLDTVQGAWDREQKRLADMAQAEINAKVEAENRKRLAEAAEAQRKADEAARLLAEKEAAGTATKKDYAAVTKAEAKAVEPVLQSAPVVEMQPKTRVTQAGSKQTSTPKKTYRPRGLTDEQRKVQIDLTAKNPVVAQLLADFPTLFVLSWPAFNKLAGTGVLDGRPDIEIGEEYQYGQRGPRG